MLRTGKRKFVCRRVLTYLNTFKTKTESHLEDWNYFIPELRKTSSYCINFDLIFEFTLYVPFQPNIGSESNS